MEYKVVSEFYLSDMQNTSIDKIGSILINQALENNKGYKLFQVIYSGDRFWRFILEKNTNE